MSVLECGRADCPRVMCDHMIDGSYYLCDDCLKEFKACMRTWPATLMNAPFTTVTSLVEQFMSTSPGTYAGLVGIMDAFDTKTQFLISTRS